MTHVSEMQNEVNPYIVETGGWFGPKADRETAESLKKTKAENKERMKKFAAKKTALRQLKATLQAQAQTEKIKGKNKALDEQIRQIDEQMKLLKEQVGGNRRQPPIHEHRVVPEHLRIEDGPV